ncbi:MAG: hypothetical protein GY870_04900 [archaeon]|nr:hypothetical protein [archaeon]
MSEEKEIDNMGKLFQLMYEFANEINGYFKMGSLTLERQAFSIITVDLANIIILSDSNGKKSINKTNLKKSSLNKTKIDVMGELIFCGMISEKNLSKRDDMAGVLEKIIKVFLKQKINFNLLNHKPLLDLFQNNQQKIEKEFISKIKNYVNV